MKDVFGEGERGVGTGESEGVGRGAFERCVRRRGKRGLKREE